MRNYEHDYLVGLFDRAETKYSISNKEDLYDNICSDKAINKAYIDFTPRTLVKKTDKSIIDKDNALKWLQDRFYEFFNGTIKEKSFDEWHENTCSGFLDKFNSDNSTYDDIKYGKAQKIVNMAFKYLYCYRDAQKYEDKFDQCHMPLDRFTLSWFNRVIVASYNLGKSRADKISITRINQTSWSNLEKGTEETEYSYKWIQHLIREYFQGTDESPFKAEFYIWNDERILLSGKAWLNEINSDKDKIALDLDIKVTQICKDVLNHTLSYLSKQVDSSNKQEELGKIKRELEKFVQEIEVYKDQKDIQ